MVPIKGRAKVKLFDVHALCRFDVRKTEEYRTVKMCLESNVTRKWFPLQGELAPLTKNVAF